MKHSFVEETLLHGAHGAECAHPFAMADADSEPIDGPTRMACIVTETDDGVAVQEFDVLPILRAAGGHWRQLCQCVEAGPRPIAAE